MKELLFKELQLSNEELGYLKSITNILNAGVKERTIHFRKVYKYNNLLRLTFSVNFCNHAEIVITSDFILDENESVEDAIFSLNITNFVDILYDNENIKYYLIDNKDCIQHVNTFAFDGDKENKSYKPLSIEIYTQLNTMCIRSNSYVLGCKLKDVPNENNIEDVVKNLSDNDIIFLHQDI